MRGTAVHQIESEGVRASQCFRFRVVKSCFRSDSCLLLRARADLHRRNPFLSWLAYPGVEAGARCLAVAEAVALGHPLRLAIRLTADLVAHPAAVAEEGERKTPAKDRGLRLVRYHRVEAEENLAVRE